jgi:metal-responsive CopG/Arc/MetJ family transcriptional regulator
VGASIVLDLPDEIRSALDEATRAEGMSANELIGRALKNYLFIRRFRQLRAETLEHMRATGRGDLSDEDVFRLVS